MKSPGDHESPGLCVFGLRLNKKPGARPGLDSLTQFVRKRRLVVRSGYAFNGRIPVFRPLLRGAAPHGVEIIGIFRI
jgi:hypothetical protein